MSSPSTVVSMDWASVWYLGVTLALLAIFAAIVVRTYRPEEKDRQEEPKYRMMQDD